MLTHHGFYPILQRTLPPHGEEYLGHEEHRANEPLKKVAKEYQAAAFANVAPQLERPSAYE